MPVVTAGAYRFAYTDEGAGPTVMLVHSSGMTAQQWRKLRAGLIGRYRVILPDLIGYGDSDRVAREPFTWQEEVAGLSAILRAVAPQSGGVHLVGHSYSGFLALQVARQGTALRSLTLLEPVLYGALWASGDPEGRADLQGMLEDTSFLHPIPPARGGDDAWLERFVDYWNGPGAWGRMNQAGRAFMQSVGRKVFYEVSAVSSQDLRIADFAGLGQRVPTLLIQGERTNPGARRVIELLAPVLPAPVVIIPGAGHNAPLTHAEAVLAALLPHLAAQGA